MPSQERKLAVEARSNPVAAAEHVVREEFPTMQLGRQERAYAIGPRGHAMLDDDGEDDLPGENTREESYGDEEHIGEEWGNHFGLIWRSIVLTPALLYAAIHWLAIHGGTAGSAAVAAGGVTLSAMAVPIAVVAAAVGLCLLPTLVRRAFGKKRHARRRR